MLPSGIKQIYSLLSGKKKSRNRYLKGEMNPHGLPGQNSYKSGKFRPWKKQFVRFWQLLTVQKKATHNRYKGLAVRRKRNFKVVGLATVMFCFLPFIMIGGWRLMMDNIQSLPFFRVSAVVFLGAETISKEKLRAASGIIPYQTSLIGLNCSQVEARLVKVPWVARAMVQRNWPSTVVISIVENVPIALLHSENKRGAQLQYIDGKGIPFFKVRPGADIDFPIITGLTEVDESIVRKKALGEVLAFLKNINGNNPYLPAQSVSEIHVDRDGELVVYLVEYPFPIFFGMSNADKNYSRLIQVLKALYKKENGKKESIAEIKYIQMDYLNDKVLVAQSEYGL
jgi:cell division septal protein FtsQ